MFCDQNLLQKNSRVKFSKKICNSLDISKCGIDYSKILDVSKPFVEKYYELDIDTLQVTRVVLINYSE